MEESLAVITQAEQDQVNRLVSAAAQAHGHLCPGQVIGVRMALLGLGLLGYSCPLGLPEIKNVVGFVEIERCLADAIATATGLRFGRGSLKLVNLGLLAATFLDMPSNRAVRLLSREEARQRAALYAPREESLHAQQISAYRVMPDEELFAVQWVEVDLPADQRPGARPAKVACGQCGVLVRSGQAQFKGGRRLCPVCAGQAYFRPLEPGEITWK